MAKKFTRGLSSLKFGVPTGLATMPAQLDEVGWSKEGTVTINIGDPEVTPIKIEEADDPIRKLLGGREITIVAETYDTSLDSMKRFFGGDVATSKWTPGVTMAAPDQAIQTTTMADGGKAMQIDIPLASVVASMSGSLSKKDGVTIKYTITPLIAVPGTAPWTWSEV